MKPMKKKVTKMIALLLGIISLISMVSYVWGTAKSKIIISDRMSDFIDAVDQHRAKNENKLVLYDLDDTVFVANKLIGTPTFFYTLINLMRQNGAAKLEAYSIARKIDFLTQRTIQVIPVETATAKAIESWQKRGMTVVGITSRGKNFIDSTNRQLDDLGLNFSSKYFSCVKTGWDKKLGLFRDGVLYAGENKAKKGVFKHFLKRMQQCGMNVSLVAYADDQGHYITAVERAAKENNVEFIGIIYGKALSNRRFDLKIAYQELVELESQFEANLVPMDYRKIFRLSQ